MRGERLKISAEQQLRMAFAGAPFFFALVAIPLGIFLGHGNRIVSFFSVALPCFVIYYPLITAGQALATAGTLSAPIALWGANIILSAAGLFLLWRLGRK